MKTFVIISLFLVAAFAKKDEGEGGEPAPGPKPDFGKMKDEMTEELKNSKCYPLIKQCLDLESECESYTITLAGQEDITESDVAYNEETAKWAEKAGNHGEHPAGGQGGEGKRGRPHGKAGDFGDQGEMLRRSICCFDKLGMVNATEKKLDGVKLEEQLSNSFEESNPVKRKIATVYDDCLGKSDNLKVPVVGETMCVAFGMMTICQTEKQKAMMAQWKNILRGSKPDAPAE